MNEIRKITNVPVDIYLFNNGLIFQKDNEVYYVDVGVSRKLVFNQNISLEKVKDHSFLVRNRQGIELFSNSFQLTNTIQYDNIKQIKDISIEHILFVNQISDGRRLSLFDINKNHLKWHIKEDRDLFYKLNGDQIIGFRNESLNCHQLTDGTELWRVDFQQYSDSTGEITTMLVHGNRLFISVKGGGMICLDTQTGGVLHQSRKMGYVMGLYEDKIYSVWNNLVNVLDPVSLSMETLDFSPTLRHLSIEIDRQKFVAKGDEFYFIRQKGNEKEALVGVLDMKTRELLWHTVIPIEAGSYWISDIQAHHNRLYVLTQGGTLHIFEKEAV